MFREQGYAHRFDTGHILLTTQGVGVVQGMMILGMGTTRRVAYFLLLDGSTDTVTVLEADVVGFCTKQERHRRQIETLPIKGERL